MTMKSKTQSRPYILLIILSTCVINILTDAIDKENELYIIRSTESGLVLDGGDRSQVRLQYFTAFREQLWKFERASRPGYFHIINQGTNTLLDWKQAESDGGAPFPLILARRNYSNNQEWLLNKDGRIVNIGTSKNIDVWDSNYAPGGQVGLWPDNGTPAQSFVLQQRTRYSVQNTTKLYDTKLNITGQP